MDRFDFRKFLMNCRKPLDVYLEERRQRIPRAVYKKLAAQIRQVIDQQDVLFAYEFEVEHRKATYKLYLSAKLNWYFVEAPGPVVRYLTAIIPQGWALWKYKGGALVEVTKDADFEILEQEIIEQYERI